MGDGDDLESNFEASDGRDGKLGGNRVSSIRCGARLRLCRSGFRSLWARLYLFRDTGLGDDLERTAGCNESDSESESKFESGRRR